jgi:non-ribosomal peptide synthase protein (TIGR01720 family)
LDEEVFHWLSLWRKEQKQLPRDFRNETNTSGTMETITRELSAAETAVLLRQAPRRFQTQMQDVLLTALGATMARWTGHAGVLVELEGHGREALLPAANITRTMGWFTTEFPVWLPINVQTGLAKQLEAVRHALAQVPRRGIGYGLLRYLAPSEKLRLQIRDLPRPEIGFNYLGQLDEALPPESLFGAASESSGQYQDERQVRCHTFDVLVTIIDGRLKLDWSFSRELHRWETVEQLADTFVETLVAVARLCKTNKTQLQELHLKEFKLSQKEMDKLLTKVGVHGTHGVKK